MSGAILNWLRASWDAIRTSLWAVPALMFFFGIAIALLMLRLPLIWPGADEALTWLHRGDGEDARNLLSTLLGAVIGMASIVFSVTVVSLSLAANAYGPRLIRTFRSSRSTQLVIGAFMMTIVYLLLVLRATHGRAEEWEVPEAAVALGSLLALMSVLALLSFIQAVATLMVADEVVRRVGTELDGAMGNLPELDSDPQPHADLPADFDARAGRIRLPREGYVQSVSFGKIKDWAEERGAIVRLDFRPGDFVVEGDQKVLVYPAPSDPERARGEIARYIASGEQPTPTQDVEFSIRHLVEVAVRALSPGINDPFTAMVVIDRLRGALARLCSRELPAAALFGDSGELRVVRHTTDYRGILDAAFHQIRQAGAEKPSILMRMLQALGGIAEHTRTSEQREALAEHARLVMNAAQRELREKSDLDDVARQFRQAMSAIAQAG